MNEMSPPEPPARAEEKWWPSSLGPGEKTKLLIFRIWDWLSLSLPSTSRVMFRQKLTGLDVARLIQPDSEGRIDTAGIERRIVALRAKAESPLHRGEWRLVNEIELLVVGLWDLPTMRVEAKRQLFDAQALCLPGAAEYAAVIEASEKDEVAMRAVLFRLVLDVQDRFRKRHLLREYVAAYTARVSLIFGLSTTFFMALIITLAWMAQAHVTALFFAEQTGIGPPAPPPPGGMRAFSSFYVALTAGLFGAAFSMMAQTRKRVEHSTLESMRTNSRFSMLFFRLGVGVGAAMILYFVFDTEFLGQGALTPTLTVVGFEVSTQTTALFTSIGGLSPNRDLSLLMLWCFVAGFSEVLVPSILRHAESTANRG